MNGALLGIGYKESIEIDMRVLQKEEFDRQ